MGHKGNTIFTKRVCYGLLGWCLAWTALWAQDKEITVELPGGATMEMVWIEPGTFLFGSPPHEDPNIIGIEHPQSQVTISRGFYLGKFELTQGQWESVMGDDPWRNSTWKGPNLPITFISWFDVQSFLQQLNEAIGSTVYRLPTEAEWEYACRAGTTTSWSFGDDPSLLGDYAWYAGNTCPPSGCEVGLKLPNPWGLYDMHGNAWEWVQDQGWAYTDEPKVDPIGSGNTEFRMTRGGWGIISNTHSAFRLAHEADWANSAIGARIVLQGVKPTSWGAIKNGP